MKHGKCGDGNANKTERKYAKQNIANDWNGEGVLTDDARKNVQNMLNAKVKAISKKEND